MNPMKLKVRGYRGKGLGSGFIKWFTFGEYSHVSLIFESYRHVEEIESIQGKGVIKHAPSDGDFDEFYAPLSEEQAFEAHMIAISLLDSSYDWKGIWGFMVRRDRHNLEKWFCSEFVAYVLYKVEYPLSRRDPYRETPTSVMESLRLVDEKPNKKEA